MITLGIDYGASNIGIALVKNLGGRNEPLFAGTIRTDARKLREKVETRAAIRRLRRTRKTKRRRLRNLREKLFSIGISEENVNHIVRFCKRRGYKSLFDKPDGEEKKDKTGELTYRFTREDFFNHLEDELKILLQNPQQYREALSTCERILNRHGDPFQEIRIIRIDNRGVSRCAWEGCNKITPRRDNALDDAISQTLFNSIQGNLTNDPGKIEVIKKSALELATIGKRIRSASGEGLKEEKKVLRRKAKEILRQIKSDFFRLEEDEEERDRAWKYIETGILNIMENSGGRNRYCREHSNAYIQTVISGKAAPFKKTISESDIISRREQIVYNKIWRYLWANYQIVI